ncbi:hypothetical protein H4R34_004437 [Dimargaris verticillata]|uniref:Myb-like domain-containing protein n=1 Tax=Dimargaris verticillata TaxID=2761393 RepID=A0A9W8B2K6_9FUNG|nr:hypothetical protein H4R34_004437 [Dimargaris verticillata]
MSSRPAQSPMEANHSPNAPPAQPRQVPNVNAAQWAPQQAPYMHPGLKRHPYPIPSRSAHPMNPPPPGHAGSPQLTTSRPYSTGPQSLPSMLPEPAQGNVRSSPQFANARPHKSVPPMDRGEHPSGYSPRMAAPNRPGASSRAPPPPQPMGYSSHSRSGYGPSSGPLQSPSESLHRLSPPEVRRYPEPPMPSRGSYDNQEYATRPDGRQQSGHSPLLGSGYRSPILRADSPSGTDIKTITVWNSQETRLLIDLRTKLAHDFVVKKRNKVLWERISQELKRRNYDKTWVQCQHKWKNMARVYKETADFNARVELQDRKTCPFYHEIRKVLEYTAAAKLRAKALTMEVAASYPTPRSTLNSGLSGRPLIPMPPQVPNLKESVGMALEARSLDDSRARLAKRSREDLVSEDEHTFMSRFRYESPHKVHRYNEAPGMRSLSPNMGGDRYLSDSGDLGMGSNAPQAYQGNKLPGQSADYLDSTMGPASSAGLDPETRQSHPSTQPADPFVIYMEAKQRLDSLRNQLLSQSQKEILARSAATPLDDDDDDEANEEEEDGDEEDEDDGHTSVQSGQKGGLCLPPGQGLSKSAPTSPALSQPKVTLGSTINAHTQTLIDRLRLENAMLMEELMQSHRTFIMSLKDMEKRAVSAGKIFENSAHEMTLATEALTQAKNALLELTTKPSAELA